MAKENGTSNAVGERSPAQWEDWVTEQVSLRREIYSKSPADMTAAYQREKGHRDDYHGRELLELLQNADDAGRGYIGSSHVLFDLSEHGLCVANTGLTFSAEGVLSLIISDHSPKLLHRSAYIGNKGLGFRAILNWTDAPAVLSGNLALQFDRRKAQGWLQEVCAHYPAVQREVDKYQQEQESPIAVLNVPSVFGKSGLSAEDTAMNATLSAAERLRQQGYDTVIAIPFHSPNARAEVERQLDGIRADLLLFANHLSSLTVCRDHKVEEWQIDRQKGQQRHEVTVTGSGMTAPQKWQIFERTDYLPEKCLTGDNKNYPGFEIKIAVPEEANNAPGYLYSYFPTNVRFPYPVLTHATLDLSNNRQHIRQSEANQYIVTELARFLARTAATHFAVSDDPWRALSLITLRSGTSIDPDLEKMQFEENLLAAALNCPILPTRDGTFRTAINARRLHPGGYDYYDDRGVDAGDWLPPQSFDDLVLPFSPPRLERAQLIKALKALKVPFLSAEELRERLNDISPLLSLQERSTLIAGLARNTLTPSDPAPTLLLGEDGILIEHEYRVFLPPADGTVFILPSWMKVRILSRTLTDQLRTEFAASGRELTAHLEAYHVQEYAFAALTLSLQAQANEKVREEPDNAARYRDETLGAVYALYRSYGRAGSVTVPPSRPEELRLPVRTRAGRMRVATDLCFGFEYSCGILTEELYRDAAPHLLVASREKLGLEGESEEISSFLRWLGISDRPHGTLIKQLTGDFQRHVQSSLRLPVTLNDWPNIAPTLVDVGIKEQHLENVATIEHLPEIIKRADPHAIVAWVALDIQYFNSLRMGGDPGASYHILYRKHQKDRIVRNQTLPSQIMWLLQQANWVPTAQGKRRLGECLLATQMSESLRNLLPLPLIDWNHPLFARLGLDQISVRNALVCAGVRTSLEDLSWEETYALLRALPSRDPAGQNARHLYRALLQRMDVEGGEGEREKFRRDGLLWGRCGDVTDYYPVAELYHHDSGTLPELIAQVVPLVEIGRGEGARKVEKLFGVVTLNREQISINVTGHEPIVDAEAFQYEIRHLKPFLYALRRHADAQGTGKRRLRDLRFIPCRRVEGVVSFGHRTQEFCLTETGETLLGEGDVAYIVTAPPLDLQDPLFADAIASVYAEILEVEGRGQLAQLVACKPHHRTLLLKRMVGREASDLLKEAREELQSADYSSDDADFPFPDAGYSPPPLASSPKALGLIDEKEGQVATENPPLGPVGSVRAIADEQQPLPPPRRIKHRVQTKIVQSGTPRPMRPPASGDRSEEAAYQFEEAEGQERFPLRVGHITGQAAFGCDILSFATKEKRDEFKNTKNRDLIERFIEVKGRNHHRGTIGLEGNEWQRALDYGERYYLYRVYESDTTGEFDIVILRNPAAVEHRLLHIVDPFREVTSEHWNVMEEFVAELPGVEVP